MTEPTLTPGTYVEIRPGAVSAWGRRFPDGGQATVLATPVDDDLVGQEIYVLPDGDPRHHTLRLRVEDLTPIGPEPIPVALADQGRRLASAREDLVAAGADPAQLVVPLHPGSTAPPGLELTPALQRAADVLFAAEPTGLIMDDIRNALAAALAGEEIARTLCDYTGPAKYHGPIPCDEHSLAVAVVRDVILGGDQAVAARRDEIIGDGS